MWACVCMYMYGRAKQMRTRTHIRIDSTHAPLITRLTTAQLREQLVGFSRAKCTTRSTVVAAAVSGWELELF